MAIARSPATQVRAPRSASSKQLEAEVVNFRTVGAIEGHRDARKQREGCGGVGAHCVLGIHVSRAHALNVPCATALMSHQLSLAQQHSAGFHKRRRRAEAVSRASTMVVSGGGIQRRLTVGHRQLHAALRDASSGVGTKARRDVRKMQRRCVEAAQVIHSHCQRANRAPPAALQGRGAGGLRGAAPRPTPKSSGAMRRHARVEGSSMSCTLSRPRTAHRWPAGLLTCGAVRGS